MYFLHNIDQRREKPPPARRALPAHSKIISPKQGEHSSQYLHTTDTASSTTRPQIQPPMNSKSPSHADINPDEPPYCFRSVRELRKNQTRYNQCKSQVCILCAKLQLFRSHPDHGKSDNIFHMIERLRLLAEKGVKETMEHPDESSNAYKMYKNFVVPPLPPAYSHLELPSYWLIYMFIKKNKKRSHKKNSEVTLISFTDLAQAIATAYKNVDDATKAWLSDTCNQLLAYNKKMRDTLADYLSERGIEEVVEDKKKKGAGKSSDRIDLLSASGRTSPGNSLASSDERRRYLLKLQAAKLSLEMQEMQNALASPALPHNEFMRLYPGASGAGTIDRYGLSPYMNHVISPREAASILAMTNGRGSMLPPFHMRQGWNSRDIEDARSQSLLRIQGSAKRKSTDEASEENSKRDDKQAKTESQEKAPSEAQAKARSQSKSPLEARAASLGEMYSAFHAPFSSSMSRAGLAGFGHLGSLHAGGFSSNNDQLMLGYQLGLQAAAKAQSEASNNSSRRISHEEMAARLQAMDEGLLPTNRSRKSDDEQSAARLDLLSRREVLSQATDEGLLHINRSRRDDEQVTSRLDLLRRQEMLVQLERAEAQVACSSGRLSNDEIAARLDALDRRLSPARNNELAARLDAFRQPGVERAEAFARNEFGLSLSEIEKTFDEMRRKR